MKKQILRSSVTGTQEMEQTRANVRTRKRATGHSIGQCSISTH